MRRSIHLFAALVAAALMLAPSSSAQTRRTTTGGGSSTSSTNTQTRRSTTTQSGNTSTQEKQSATRSSGGSTTSSSQNTRSTNNGTNNSGSSYSGSITPVRRATSGSSSGSGNTSGSQIRRTTTQTGSGSTTGGSSTTDTRSSGSSSTTQARRSTGGSSATTTTTTTRDNTGSSATTQTRRSTGSSGSTTTATDTRGSAQTQTRTTTTVNEPVGGTVRSNSNVTRRGLTGDRLSGNSDTRSVANDNYRDRYGNYRYGGYDDFRMDERYNVHRVPPRDRGWMAYDRPGRFWYDTPHYYGYRVNYLPTGYRRVRILGIDFYVYDNIYYRRYGSNYVICRPPHGTWIEHAIDRAILRDVTFAYYYNSYRAYNAIDRNLRTIAEQNRIIAENNARIAAQNRSLAWNNDRALSAYELANRLGLVQSYAYASYEYFYQDGVFYIYEGGRYQVIIPPAGALVGSLPDDYDVIVMSGIEYYKVDDTVYRTTLFDGIPYLEVLGQMYGSLASRYNYY